jgi:hypothetical protein
MTDSDVVYKSTQSKDIVYLGGIILATRSSISRRISHFRYGVINLRAAKANEHQAAVVLNEKVVTPNVAVNHILGVDEMKRFGDLDQPSDAG